MKKVIGLCLLSLCLLACEKESKQVEINLNTDIRGIWSVTEGYGFFNQGNVVYFDSSDLAYRFDNFSALYYDRFGWTKNGPGNIEIATRPGKYSAVRFEKLTNEELNFYLMEYDDTLLSNPHQVNYKFARKGQYPFCYKITQITGAVSTIKDHYTIHYLFPIAYSVTGQDFSLWDKPTVNYAPLDSFRAELTIDRLFKDYDIINFNTHGCGEQRFKLVNEDFLGAKWVWREIN